MIKKVSLRDAYRNAVLHDPKASRKDHYDHFLETVRSNPAYLDALAEDYFDRMATQWKAEKIDGSWSLVGTSSVAKRVELNTEQRAESRAARERHGADLVAAKIETVKRFVFLEMIMPNGKKLRDCTGAELAKFGGFFTEMSRHIKPNQVVDKHLTDRDFQEVFARFGGKRGSASRDLHA